VASRISSSFLGSAYFLARLAWRFSFSVFWARFFSMLFFVFLSFVAMPTSL
jgi:hypothetical protein